MWNVNQSSDDMNAQEARTEREEISYLLRCLLGLLRCQLCNPFLKEIHERGVPLVQSI